MCYCIENIAVENQGCVVGRQTRFSGRDKKMDMGYGIGIYALVYFKQYSTFLKLR